MFKKTLLSIVLLWCLVYTGGCYSRVAKEALYGIKGADGRSVIIQGRQHEISMLASQYGSFKIGEIKNDIGSAGNDLFLATLPKALNEILSYRDASFGETLEGKDKQELGPFLTGPPNKTLLITGVLIHYDLGDLLDKIAGPMQEAICRIEIRDADTNKLLVEVNCVGRAKSSFRKGPEELAEGVAKAVRELLEAEEED